MNELYPELTATVLDSTDARALAEFYRHLLGLEYRDGHEPPPPGEPGPGDEPWLILCDASGRPRLSFQEVDELARPTWPDPAVPQQLHLDLTVATAAELEVQHERALALGATLLADRSDDPDDRVCVYADPAGHPFCIIVG